MEGRTNSKSASRKGVGVQVPSPAPVRFASHKNGRLAPTVDGLRKARAQGGDERSEIVGRNNGQEILRGEPTSRYGDDRHVCSQGCQQISRPLFRDGRLHD